MLGQQHLEHAFRADQTPEVALRPGNYHASAAVFDHPVGDDLLVGVLGHCRRVGVHDLAHSLTVLTGEQALQRDQADRHTTVEHHDLFGDVELLSGQARPEIRDQLVG